MTVDRRSDDAVVMFVDIVGSIRAKNLDYAAAVELAGRHSETVARLVEELCQSQGGESQRKNLGDGVMCWFQTGPPELALQIAYRVLEEVAAFPRSESVPATTAVAIATGSHLYFSGSGSATDVHGPAIDRAARMVLMAKPRQILIDDAYAVALGPGRPPRTEATFPSIGEVRRTRIGAIAEPVIVHVVRVDSEVDRSLSNEPVRQTELRTLLAQLLDLRAQTGLIAQHFRFTSQSPDDGAWASLVDMVKLLRSLYVYADGPYTLLEKLVATSWELHGADTVLAEIGAALLTLEELVHDPATQGEVVNGGSKQRKRHLAEVSGAINRLQDRTDAAIRWVFNSAVEEPVGA